MSSSFEKSFYSLGFTKRVMKMINKMKNRSQLKTNMHCNKFIKKSMLIERADIPKNQWKARTVQKIAEPANLKCKTFQSIR